MSTWIAFIDRLEASRRLSGQRLSDVGFNVGPVRPDRRNTERQSSDSRCAGRYLVARPRTLGAARLTLRAGREDAGYLVAERSGTVHNPTVGTCAWNGAWSTINTRRHSPNRLQAGGFVQLPTDAASQASEWIASAQS